MFVINKNLNISNSLSAIRLLSAIPLWFLFDDINNNNDVRYIILGIVLIDIITDYLDGYLARKYKETTEVGKIIDPLADKIVVGIVVIKLFVLGEIPGYFFFMVIVRDILIFLGGILLSAKMGRVLPSNMIGKVTVTILALLLVMIIVNIDKSSLIYQLVYYLTMILLIVSFIAYLIRAFEFINKKNYESV